MEVTDVKDSMTTLGGAYMGFVMLQQVNWMLLPEYVKLATALLLMVGGYFAYRDKKPAAPKE